MEASWSAARGAAAGTASPRLHRHRRQSGLVLSTARPIPHLRVRTRRTGRALLRVAVLATRHANANEGERTSDARRGKSSASSVIARGSGGGGSMSRCGNTYLTVASPASASVAQRSLPGRPRRLTQKRRLTGPVCGGMALAWHSGGSMSSGTGGGRGGRGGGGGGGGGGGEDFKMGRGPS
jgi:hypothetical protein